MGTRGAHSRRPNGAWQPIGQIDVTCLARYGRSEAFGVIVFGAQAPMAGFIHAVSAGVAQWRLVAAVAARHRSGTLAGIELATFPPQFKIGLARRHRRTPSSRSV